jgi:hypothetical protein
MWFTFFILYCNFIPISLYVTIEIVNYGQVASVGARRAAPHCSFGWFVERTARVVPQCWWCGLRLLLGAVHCFCVLCAAVRVTLAAAVVAADGCEHTRGVGGSAGPCLRLHRTNRERSRLADPRSASPSPRRSPSPLRSATTRGEAFFIDSDLEMYDPVSDTAALARTSNMGADLGQVVGGGCEEEEECLFFVLLPSTAAFGAPIATS